MMYPSFVDLNYFLAVAKTANLSQAAETLGVNQSTLSMALARLEATMGVKLYSRTRGGIILTRAGREFVGECRNLLAHWQRVSEATLGRQHSISGHFTLACAPSAGYVATCEGLKKLKEQHPEISLSFINIVPATVADLVIGGQVDFGLSTVRDPHPDVLSRKITTVEIGLWCRRDLSSSCQETLIYDRRLVGTDKILKRLARERLPLTAPMPCESIDLAAGLTAGGLGIGILVDQVAKVFGEKTLVRVHPQIGLKYELFLLYRKELAKSAAAQTFIRLLAL